MSKIRVQQRDDGFTVIEMMVALGIVVLASVAFLSVLVTTTTAAASDDIRGRASQLAAQQVELLQSAPWATVATTSSASCSGGELARTAAAPAGSPGGAVTLGGKAFTFATAVTWVGTTCTSTEPGFGRLRITTKVSWTDRGRARSTLIVGFRNPPDGLAPPAATSAPAANPAATPSVPPSPTTSPSPTPSPSGTASPLPGPSPSPSPAASPTPATPVFTAFTPAAPNTTFCVYQGATISSLTITVNVSNISSGDAVTIGWSGPPARRPYGTMAFTGVVSPGTYSYRATIPAGTQFATGATQIELNVAATTSHLAGAFAQTFSVTAAQNKNRC